MTDRTTTLLVLVHEPDQARDTVDGIVNAICPYLGTFGQKSSITSTERLRELHSGEEVSSATVLRVTLAGTAKTDSASLVAKLQRFLKQTAKDADVDVKFDLWRVEVTEN
jgi:hypothetical protein